MGPMIDERVTDSVAPRFPSLTHLSVLSRREGSVTAHEGGAPTFVFSGDYVAARRRHTLMARTLLKTQLQLPILRGIGFPFRCRPCHRQVGKEQ
jgi:hypothetical protein